MISTTKVRIIETDVLNILKNYEQVENKPVELPIPIFEIAEKLFHLRVDLENFRNNHDDKLGIIIPDKRWIILNKESLDIRLRFTLAHELGHWWIDQVNKYPVNDKSNLIPLADNNKYKREELANYFASVILMPKSIVLDEVKKYKLLNESVLEALSETFLVSYKAMLIRLKGLRDELESLSLYLDAVGTPGKRKLISVPSDPIKKYAIAKVDYEVIDHNLYRKLKNLRKSSRYLYALLSEHNNQNVEVLMELDCFDGFVFVDPPHEKTFESVFASNQSTWFGYITNGQWIRYMNKTPFSTSPIFTEKQAYFTRSTDNEVLTRQPTSLNLNNLIEPSVKLNNRADAKAYVRNMKALGKKVVIVTGCFDLITNAHVKFMKRAKAQGDILVVGLEDDNRVKTFKGPLRPVNTIAQRVEVMEAFEFVDKVFVIRGSPKTEIKNFYIRLHRELKADILAVSEGDPYLIDRKDEIEAGGGELLIVSRLEDGSTTSLIREFLDETEFSEMVFVSKRKLRNIEENEPGWRQLKLGLG